jgi:hypothetical protein
VNRVQNVQAVQPLRGACPERSRRVQFVLPHVAGEDEGGGLNDLNDLNYLNEPK